MTTDHSTAIAEAEAAVQAAEDRVTALRAALVAAKADQAARGESANDANDAHAHQETVEDGRTEARRRAALHGRKGQTETGSAPAAEVQRKDGEDTAGIHDGRSSTAADGIAAARSRVPRG